jgi:hypothetical protein
MEKSVAHRPPKVEVRPDKIMIRLAIQSRQVSISEISNVYWGGLETARRFRRGFRGA